VSRDLRHDAEAGASSLDDEADRAELRDRYYGLLQELRVVVTGVQVLLAFLLTVPFAQRFAELNESEQGWFGAALVCATCSVIAFVTPTAMHRFGKRTARGERLALSIVMTRVGLFFLGLAMLLSFAVVVDFLYHGIVPALLVASVSVVMVGAWVVLPFATRLLDRD
jgi:hypothetical protein